MRNNTDGNKSFFKKIFESRAFWVVLSALAAVVLWLYVTTVEDAEVKDTFYGVQVKFTGEEALREANGLIITDIENTSVTLRLTGNRQMMSRLSETNLSVTVDLVDVTRTGTISHAYTVTYPSGVDESAIKVESRNPQTITFYVDNLSKKTVPVRGRQEVSTAEGYMAEELVFEPDTVVIRGPAGALARVEAAQVVIKQDEVDRTISANVSYTLVDSEGNSIEDPYITLDTETVSFTLPVVSVKDVALAVDLVPGGGASSENVIADIEPSGVTIAGDAEILEGINRIVLGTVDLADFPLSFEDSFAIPFPNDVQNLTGVTEAKVTLRIRGLETAKFTVTNIECINVGAGFTSETLTKSVEVTVRAPAEIIELITANAIRIVADLKDIGNAPGKVSVPVKVYIDSYSEAGALGDYNVVVSITKEE